MKPIWSFSKKTGLLQHDVSVSRYKRRLTVNNFAKEFVTQLNGKVSDEDMATILRELEMFSGDYDIRKKETSIVEYHPQIPECFKVYMVSKKIEGLTDETLKTYSGYLKDFFISVNKPIDQITANDIRVYLYQYQQLHNVKERTMDGKRLVLNTFFEWCRDEGYINKNPCKQIRPIKYTVELVEPLSDIEMEILRDSLRTYREKAMVEVFYSTGCRVSELVNLNRDDVNFKTKEVLLFGKGKKYRISYLNARAEVALKKYLMERTDNDPALFVKERKPYTRLQKTGVESIIRKIGKRAGIERRVYPHLIRHTHATTALNRGMDVTKVQKILGHKKLETTMIYAKVSQEDVKYDHKRYVV